MIESLNNERIKNYAKLLNKKYRDEDGLFIAPGEHLVEEALKKEIVKEILLLIGEDNKYGDVTYVSSEVMKKVSGLDNAPKVLAIVKKFDTSNIDGNVVILDDIKDPGNLGTIIRSAVAFNYQTIILSNESVDPYNIKCIRASEGMIFNINIVIGNLYEIIPSLKNDGYIIFGTDVVKGNLPEKEEKKHALIIGSEAKGMHDDIKMLCDKNLYIRMNPLCESLNAGISASILMYELNGKL